MNPSPTDDIYVDEPWLLLRCNDTRKLELVSDEDQRWIRYTLAAPAIEAGIKKIAVVMAPHGLSKRVHR